MSKCCAILSDAAIIAKKVVMYKIQSRNTLVVSVNTLVFIFILYYACVLFARFALFYVSDDKISSTLPLSGIGSIGSKSES